MKYFIGLLFIILSYNYSFSQSNSYFTFSNKVLFYDFSDINYKSGNDYPDLENFAIRYSLGKQYIGKKGAFGLNLSYLYNNNSNVKKKIMFQGYEISSNFEYNILFSKDFQIYPLVEFGFNKYDIILTEDQVGGFSIFDILNKSIPNYTLSNIGYFIDFGLGMKYFFDIWIYKLGIGINSGYRINFDNKWKYNNINRISDSVAKTNGFYIGFNFYVNLMKRKI